MSVKKIKYFVRILPVDSLYILERLTGSFYVKKGGKIGTSKIELTAKLQKYNTSKKSWTTIKSWAKTVQATRGSNNPTYQLTSKGTYRSHITAVVWKDGKSEKVGASSKKKVY